MLNLPAPITAAASEASTAPLMLIELQIGHRFFNTRGSDLKLGALGLTWHGGRADVLSIDNWERAVVRLANHSGELTNQIMSGGWRGTTARIHLAELEDNPGISGHSVIFDGASGRMTTPVAANGHPRGNGSHTLESWLYIESLKVLRSNIITLLPTGAGGMHWLLNNDGTIQAGRWGGGGGALVNVPIGEWFHFATTYQASTGLYRVYVNGQLEQEVTLTQPFSLHGGFVAAQNVSGQQWANVRMAETRLWTMTRSQGEIVFRMFDRLSGGIANLVGLWQPEGNNTSHVPDVTAFNNDAALAGTFEIRSLDGAFHLLFEGESVAATTVNPWVTLELAQKGDGTHFTPRWRIEPPTFNHLPPPGKVIVWDGEHYELKPR